MKSEYKYQWKEIPFIETDLLKNVYILSQCIKYTGDIIKIVTEDFEKHIQTPKIQYQKHGSKGSKAYSDPAD